jgi:hypothetical protein
MLAIAHPSSAPRPQSGSRPRGRLLPLPSRGPKPAISDTLSPPLDRTLPVALWYEDGSRWQGNDAARAAVALEVT